jgi:histidinol-phosphate aminotransferase
MLWPSGRGGSRSIRRRPGSVIVVEPAFDMYAACAEAAGLGITRVLPEPDFAFPIERVLKAITPRTRLIYLNDPNNPTGLGIPAGLIEQIATAASQAVVLVDEAYAEFSGRSCVLDLPHRRRNVVVGRTFAKAHGLAGLRIGALVSAPETVAAMRPILPPFSINICAATALEAALDDRAYLEWYLGEVTASRQLIYQFARRRAVRHWPSEGNYVLMRLAGSATEVVAAMAARGVLIRDRSQLPGCDGCIRITAGLVTATERCLAELEDVLASRTN